MTLKILRHNLKIITISLLVSCMLPAMMYFVFRSPKAQLYLTQKVINYLHDRYGLSASLGGIDISISDGVVFERLLVLDTKGKELLNAKEIAININTYNENTHSLIIDQIKVSGTKFSLYEIDTIGTLNLSRVISNFEAKDTVIEPETQSQPMEILLDKLVLNNCSFDYKSYVYDATITGFNPDNIGLRNINLQIKEIAIKDSILFHLTDLSLKERCGFNLEHIYGDVLISDKQIKITDLFLLTPNTEILGKYFKMSYTNWESFLDFNSKVKLEAGLYDSTYVNTKDIAYFATPLNGYERKIYIAGDISGKVNKLKAKNIKIKFGDITYLNANLELRSLTDLENFYIFADIKTLTTSKNDLELIEFAPYGYENRLQLPDILNKLGRIEFAGNHSGNLKDFVTYGSFQTSLGQIITDLSTSIDTIGNVYLKGKLQTREFDLGIMLDQDKTLGKITANIDLDGIITDSSKVTATISGNLSKLDINQYSCTNIELAAGISNNRFEGNVNINDPNLKVDFVGNIDLSEKLPVFNFTTDLYKANLGKLNLTKDSLTKLSLYLDANFVGLNVDELKGNIICNQLVYQDKTGQLNTKRIIFTINEKEEGYKSVNLKSDYAEAELKGKFKYNTLYKSINSLINKYLPAYRSANTEDETDQSWKGNNNFVFDISLINTLPLTNFFLPELTINKKTKIFGRYNSAENILVTTIESPVIEYGKKRFENFVFGARSKGDIFEFTAKSDKTFLLNDTTSITFDFTSRIKNDVMTSTLEWNRLKSLIKYEGKIVTNTTFYKLPDKKTPLIEINIDKSKLIISDTTWYVAESSINIDTSSINFINFSIYNNDQSLIVDGVVSENEKDSLIVDIRNFNISNFNIITSESGIILDGVLNGYTKISNLYHKPNIFTNDSIQGLKINTESLGNLSVRSEWEQESQSAVTQVVARNGKIRILDIHGNYFPEGEKLKFEANLDKLQLNLLNPIMKNVLGNIVGRASGKFNINGNISKPEFSGKLVLTKFAFDVIYLGTRYNFNDSITFKNNEIVLSNIKIYNTEINTIVQKSQLKRKRKQQAEMDSLLKDNLRNANTAILSGSIKHDYFSKFRFNISINANKFLFLDNESDENPYFYGMAYATGQINITGNPKRINFNINAKTEKYTKFCIPLTSTGEISESNDYIKFSTKDTSETMSKEKYKVDLSGIQLLFNLEVTPEAEVQLIFDEKVGDVIKARGSGNIKMKINTLGDFFMYGDYTISKGDYLFTLQNVINKKFEIQEGGVIRWNGDPMNANMDIKAIYKIKKVPVYDLTLNQTDKEIRIPVECAVNMKNSLMNPDVSFGIDVPNQGVIADDKYINQLNTLPSDEMNKQFLSLLIINRFMPLPGLSSTSQSQSPGVVSSNAYELLSNQLNYWLSQISKQFDIGVNYRPGDLLNSNQLQLALSTQLFNDRVTVTLNSNVGVGGSTNQSGAEGVSSTTSNNKQAITGDFDVDYKITKSGKLRIKYSARTNDNRMIYEDAQYVQGIGIFYKEDFDTFADLTRKYREKMKNRKKTKESKNQQIKN